MKKYLLILVIGILTSISLQPVNVVAGNAEASVSVQYPSNFPYQDFISWHSAYAAGFNGPLAFIYEGIACDGYRFPMPVKIEALVYYCYMMQIPFNQLPFRSYQILGGNICYPFSDLQFIFVF